MIRENRWLMGINPCPKAVGYILCLVPIPWLNAQHDVMKKKKLSAGEGKVELQNKTEGCSEKIGKLEQTECRRLGWQGTTKKHKKLWQHNEKLL